MIFQFQASPFAQRLGQIFTKFGIVDVILPFVLVFAIMYAILQHIPIFRTPILNPDGTEKSSVPNKKINTVIAAIIGIIFIVPHITGTYTQRYGFDPVDALNKALPATGFVIIAVVMFLILTGLLGWRIAGSWTLPIGVIAMGLVAYIFLLATGTVGSASGFFSFLNDPDLQTLIVIILVFGIIIWFVTSEGGEDPEVGYRRFMRWTREGPRQGGSSPPP